MRRRDSWLREKKGVNNISSTVAVSTVPGPEVVLLPPSRTGCTAIIPCFLSCVSRVHVRVP